MISTQKTDQAAILLSGLCVIHCLALPILALALPVAGALSEVEAVHWGFAAAAIIASASVVLRSTEARAPSFVVPAGLGIMLLIFGLFSEQAGVDEAVPTILGGLCLAFAHLRRLGA